ncbi:hypothetical protein EVAR_81897_1 [Eumeta japonica]|uniref:Uncharacterized protein n=1 Tax=Eumeta variegata TaxID=151549 RepID=A0A4C1UX21_EUMVA|nr:hypothetical protein EVAR_81897_1 [Eumeta japonica]
MTRIWYKVKYHTCNNFVSQASLCTLQYNDEGKSTANALHAHRQTRGAAEGRRAGSATPLSVCAETSVGINLPCRVTEEKQRAQ